jgi:hypothetical protein
VRRVGDLPEGLEELAVVSQRKQWRADERQQRRRDAWHFG